MRREHRGSNWGGWLVAALVALVLLYFSSAPVQKPKPKPQKMVDIEDLVGKSEVLDDLLRDNPRLRRGYAPKTPYE